MRTSVIIDQYHELLAGLQTPAVSDEPRHGKKTALSMCEDIGADQLRGSRAADQRLCLCYIDSTCTIPPLSNSKISRLLPTSVAVHPGWYRRNPEYRFCQEAAQLAGSQY